MVDLKNIIIKPEILLPKSNIDLHKWAVIACDQYTSELNYWKKVTEIVSDEPSTLNVILPEVYLNSSDCDNKIINIKKNMFSYINKDIFQTFNNMIYVERTINDKIRKGVMLCLDLEQYDYSVNSKSLIRATEGTIVDRIPPRLKIRNGAVLEIPHIMVLIDDPDKTIIENLSNKRLNEIYDFDLMLNGGNLKGFQMDLDSENLFLDGVSNLTNKQAYMKKYDVDENEEILLFAVGDGNHSLATAKALWEKIKIEDKVENHPARYALVEVVNLHDDSLVFHPIHRVIFEFNKNIIDEAKLFFKSDISYEECNIDEMKFKVNNQKSDVHIIGVVSGQQCGILKIVNSLSTIPVATIQPFLDKYVQGNAKEIDYVHGDDVVINLGKVHSNIGIFLPKISKFNFFNTVIKDGSFPRKTFSIGEAHEKRYYMECRRISYETK
jgi:hypothetical protein